MKFANGFFLTNENLSDEQPFLKKLNVDLNAVNFSENIFSFKEVFVVGNGQINDVLGSLIDQSSVVVRFNNYKTKAFESVVGTKTDIHVINSQNLRLIDDEHIHLLIDTSVPTKMYEVFKCKQNELKNLRVIKPSLYFELTRQLNKRYKTQGFFFIEISKLFFKKVEITGFIGNTHYFNAKHKMYTAHPLEDEHKNYLEWQSENFKIYE